LDFLHTLYPHSIFVFVVRSSFNTIASNRTRFHNCNTKQILKCVCKRWQQQIENFLQWHQNPQCHSYLIKYEDLIEEKGEFLSLLQYLGKTLGTTQKQMLRVVSGSSFPGNTNFNSRWKTLPLSWLYILDKHTGKLNDELGLINLLLPRHFLRLLPRHIQQALIKSTQRKGGASPTTI